MHKRGKYVDALRTVKYCNIPFWRDPESWRSQCSVPAVKVKLRRGEREGHPPIRQQDVERGHRLERGGWDQASQQSSVINFIPGRGNLKNDEAFSQDKTTRS